MSTKEREALPPLVEWAKDPLFPMHPEPRTYAWTELEKRAIKAYGDARAQAARMEAMRYRAGNTALIEALMDMVLQHCCSEPEDLIRHGYLSSNEAAVEVLEEAGMIENDRLNWPALQRRKDAEREDSSALGGKEKANG